MRRSEGPLPGPRLHALPVSGIRRELVRVLVVAVAAEAVRPVPIPAAVGDHLWRHIHVCVESGELPRPAREGHHSTLGREVQGVVPSCGGRSRDRGASAKGARREREGGRRSPGVPCCCEVPLSTSHQLGRLATSRDAYSSPLCVNQSNKSADLGPPIELVTDDHRAERHRGERG
jgi:hypothetical protein